MGCLANVYSTSWGIRDRINSLFFRILCLPQLHISQSSGIYLFHTPDHFNLLFLGSPCLEIHYSTWTTKIHCQQQKYTINNLTDRHMGLPDHSQLPC